ncbi:hypothetical protein PGT21_032477 [Puccinia graminis f. sp. tritici]|uniref:Hexosyltransferase n=1 Tax=Puccinia graminis f. sp. tritici TaxID=56615 RepID=A0A5B0QZF6_PUCGR|nr:hypothetical protein PGT21_032477 [Puccinia graminis f. sp. tritici]
MYLRSVSMTRRDSRKTSLINTIIISSSVVLSIQDSGHGAGFKSTEFHLPVGIHSPILIQQPSISPQNSEHFIPLPPRKSSRQQDQLLKIPIPFLVVPPPMDYHPPASTIQAQAQQQSMATPESRHRSNSHQPSPKHYPHHPSRPAPRARPGPLSLSRFLWNPLRRTQRAPFLPISGTTPPPDSLGRSAPSRPNQAGVGFLLLLAGISCYLLLVSLIDQPNSLQLDPTIDPTTLLLRPPGDPRKPIDLTQPNRASVALSQSLIERESGFYLRMQHVIHPNITSLNSSSLFRAIEFAQKHLSEVEKIDQPEKWYVSDPALVQNRPASRFHCQPNSPTLLFLGIFTTPSGFEKRNLIRTLVKADLPPNALIELKFISGEPKNENWMELIKAEQALHHDLVILKDLEDNIDLGKTYQFFRWIAQREKRRQDLHLHHQLPSTDSLPESERVRDQLGLNGWPEHSLDSSIDDRDPRKVVYGKPKFVIKSDDDTFLVIPNLLKAFKDLDCQKNVYWGTSQGSSKLFDPYFRGLGYGLSWPLVEWIGTSNMSLKSQVGIEDARVGAWLTDLDPVADPLVRINEGWKMADWNQVEIDKEVIALHWLKNTEWFPMIRLKVIKVWESAHQAYRWDYFL